MICPECYRDFITTWSDVNGKSCTCQGCGHHWRLSKNKRVEDKDLRAQLARQSAIIAAQAELIEAHDEYLLAADDVAEIKWECVGGHPVPEELRERLQLAYERRKSACAKLAEVQKCST